MKRVVVQNCVSVKLTVTLFIILNSKFLIKVIIIEQADLSYTTVCYISQMLLCVYIIWCTKYIQNIQILFAANKYSLLALKSTESAIFCCQFLIFTDTVLLVLKIADIYW